MTEFQNHVLAIVRAIPTGKVASYGQVAAYLGTPNAARQVGWALRSMEGTDNFPWWRVVNSKGLITIKGNKFNSPELQKELLENEKVPVSEDYRIDMDKYRFKPDLSVISGFGLPKNYVNTVLVKFNFV